MRVKSLLGPVGLAVMLAIAVPGVSSAMRAGGDDPVEVVDEDPPAAADDPVEEEAPDEPVVEDEADDEPVIEDEADDEPVIEDEADDEPVIEDEADDEPVIEDEPVDETPIDLFEDEEGDDEADTKPVRTTNRPEKQSGDCGMDSYQSERVSSLDDAESARGEKADRNDDGEVCRKEIPGQGRGNTGEGTNIKDNKSAK